MNRTHQELLHKTLNGSNPADEAPMPVQAEALAQETSHTPLFVPTHDAAEHRETAADAVSPAPAVAGTSTYNAAGAVDTLRGPLPGRPMPWKPSADDLPSLQARTSAAEQFRKLRSRLLEYRSLRPLKTILMSSALPQEGKSFVAANLAVGLNQHRDARVLLIDGDMRRYSLQRYFGSTHKPGLADYLAGTAEAEDVMQKADAETLASYPGLAQLSLIPGGGMVEHVADLSEDSRFGLLIQSMAPLFDWIVVDSSPVTLVSDATNLARHCDGVLLVVRSGVTQYRDAQKAQLELQASNLLGVVLNAVEDRPAPSYYGYGPAGAAA
ncbi:MAG: CpsD/CapB family tyrosine-protein kinase [Janthinobacterium lividum]